MDDCCIDCRFWKEEVAAKTDEGEEALGICRRLPPVLVLTDHNEQEWEQERLEAITDERWMCRAAHSFIYWAQPRVIEAEWCGEFIALKQKEPAAGGSPGREET